jgi:hypothetical protein
MGLFYDQLTSETLTGAWGIRQLISTYTGPICRLRQHYIGVGGGPADVEIDRYADANGELELPLNTTDFDYHVVRLYDQTGGDDLVQPTASLQPVVEWNATPTGKHTIKFDGVDDYLKGATDGTTRPYMTARPFLIVVCGGNTANESFATVAKIVQQSGSNPSPYGRFGVNLGGSGFPRLEAKVNAVAAPSDPYMSGLNTTGSGWTGFFMSANNVFATPGLRETQALPSARDVTYPASTALYVGANGAGTENIGLHYTEIVMGQSSTIDFATASPIINKVVAEQVWGAKRAYRIISTDDFGAAGGETSFAEVRGYLTPGGTNIFASANGARAFANRRINASEDEFKANDGNNATQYSAGSSSSPIPTWGVLASAAGDLAQMVIRARGDGFATTTIKVFTVEQIQADGTWVQIGSFDLTSQGVSLGQEYTLNFPIAVDFAFDYEIEAPAATIEQDFISTFAIELGTSFTFDYRYTTVSSFTFDYSIALGVNYSFTNAIELGVAFDFDYRYVVAVNFDFDYAVDLATSFEFDYKLNPLVIADFSSAYAIELGRSVTFNFAYVITANFTFDFRYQIAQTVTSTYAVELGKSFTSNFSYLIAAEFTFDFFYDIGVPFTSSYAIELAKTFELDYAYGFIANFSFDYRIAVADVDASFTFAYLINTVSLSSGFILVPETPVNERWEFVTVTAVARDGSEQRAAIRRNPRVSVDYTFTVTTEEERRVMFDLLYRQTRGIFLVPLYAYGVQIAAPVAQGATLVSYNDARTDIRSGDFLYYMTPDGETGAFEIAAIVGTNELQLAFGAGFALPAGSWIMPALEMTAATGAGLSMRALGGSVGVTFEAMENRRSLARPGSTATVPTFDGFPIIEQRHTADAAITDLFESGLVSLDEAADVRRALFSPQTSTFVGGARSYRIGRNSPAMDLWRDFLDMTKGKRSPFLISTYRNDLTPGVNVAGTTLNVIGREYLDKFEQNAFKRIEIEAAGVVSRHKVTAVSNITGGLALTLDTPYANADIDRVSFLNLARLNSDVINVVHEQLDTVINLSIRSVDA